MSGQAWHWIDPVAGARTVGRALRPGGRLAVFWNSFRLPPGLGEAMTAVIQRVVPDMPLGNGLPGPDGYARLAGIGAVIDDVGGQVTMGYTTVVATARKTMDPASN